MMQNTENSKKWWWNVLAILLIIAALFFAGWSSSTAWHLKHDGKPQTTTDTLVIVKWDTLRIDNPVEVVRWTELRDTVLIGVAKTDTIIVGDTLFLPHPREFAVYSDSTYKAQVSGISPRLDWIEVYPKTIETTIETTILPTEKKRHWGVGAQVGFGVTSTGAGFQLSPYLGVGLQYNFFSF